MISVVMSVFNEKISDLEKSINSVLNQSLKRFEFIIICDNPGATEIKKLLLKEAEDDSRIRLIFNKVNLRQNLSRNKAIKSASNDYIVVMDADDIMDKNRLEKQYAFARENNLDICFTNVSIINYDGDVTRKNIFINRNITNQKMIKKILFSHSIALGPTFMFRKDAFQKLGGYTDMNVEDYELVSKFIVAKKRLGYIGDSLTYKRLRMNSISYNSLYEQYVIMNSISKYLKKYDGNKMIPYEYIKNNVNNITGKQLYSYKKYSAARYAFNDNKSFKIIMLIFCRIFFSKTVLFHLIWAEKNKIIDFFYERIK